MVGLYLAWHHFYPPESIVSFLNSVRIVDLKKYVKRKLISNLRAGEKLSVQP